MTGETPEVRSNKRKPKEETEETEETEDVPIYLQDVPKMSAKCPQNVIEKIINRIIEKNR